MKIDINLMPLYAKVWVYQCSTKLNEDQEKFIERSGLTFIESWSAHGARLKASFNVLYNRFVVISVDEKEALASGCSIDKSVKFIKELEQELGLDFFDRMKVAYRNQSGEILTCSLEEFEKLAERHIINENTLVFNNMITTKQEFDTNWEVPLKNSWQSRVLA